MMNNILTDLDDFLAPSQECIKMIVPSKNEKKEGTGSNKATVVIGNDLEDEDAF